MATAACGRFWRGRLWLADGACIRLRSGWPNHVWEYDFVEDRTHDGRKFRMLTVIDEYTRECLAIEVDRRLASDERAGSADPVSLGAIAVCLPRGLAPSGQKERVCMLFLNQDARLPVTLKLLPDVGQDASHRSAGDPQ